MRRRRGCRAAAQLADHALLGPGASVARFSSVTVPAGAVWVQPGTEYDTGGYRRVSGATIHYVVDGRPGSFVIGSMISWCGEWYGVHLAAIR